MHATHLLPAAAQAGSLAEMGLTFDLTEAADHHSKAALYPPWGEVMSLGCVI